MRQLQLKEVPKGATVHFVMGTPGAGKSSFIDYLLGHEFRESQVDSLLVKDSTKPYSKIVHGIEPSQFESFDVFSLNDNVFLCELPGELIGVLKTEGDMWRFEKCLIDKHIDAKIILVTSLNNINESYGHNLWYSLPRHWGDFIRKHLSDIKFIMNNVGDKRYLYTHYNEKCSVLLKVFESWIQKSTYTKERPKATIQGIIALLKEINENNMFVWSHHADQSCREAVLPLLIGVKTTEHLTLHSPEAQQLRFFKTKRVIRHASQRKTHEHNFKLHQLEGKQAHVDVSYPEGWALITSAVSEKEMDRAFDDPDYRTPGTLALLKTCTGNYAMTLDFATQVYLEMMKTDVQEANEVNVSVMP